MVACDELSHWSPQFSFARSHINSLDRQLNSWNWRNSRLKELLHRTQVWFTFLTFYSDHCLFQLILPNNESDRSFLKATGCVQVQPCRRATHQTWKGKRNPQTCYWIRPSKQLKARDVCSLSSPLLFLRNVWDHIVHFFCRRRPEGQRFQPPKASTMCRFFRFFGKVIRPK